MNNLFAIGLAGCVLGGINALLWFLQWVSERQWKFIGSDVRAWCLWRMWLNIGLSVVFAVAGVAGWWMRA